MTYTTVIDFWFSELTPKQWWQKSDQLDAEIKQRFSDLHQQVSLGELSHWRAISQGALAEILVLDQFSRNMYRNTTEAFANDNLAVALAQRAVELGQDHKLSDGERGFLYMPFMHSESALIHEQAVPLFESLNDASKLSFELAHKRIIDRFGRYPHRNEILGRESSAEEIEFLTQPNSSF